MLEFSESIRNDMTLIENAITEQGIEISSITMGQSPLSKTEWIDVIVASDSVTELCQITKSLKSLKLKGIKAEINNDFSIKKIKSVLCVSSYVRFNATNS